MCFVIRAVFLPCGGVDSFSSSLDMSSIRFENFEATGLDSHSVNNKVRILSLLRSYKIIKISTVNVNNCC